MGEIPKFLTIREQFTKLLADHITVSVEDLQSTEVALINKAFEMFDDKLTDIKVANDEVKRLTLELSNLKAMGTIDDLRYEERSTGICPICGKDDTYRNDY